MKKKTTIFMYTEKVKLKLRLRGHSANLLRDKIEVEEIMISEKARHLHAGSRDLHGSMT